MSELSIELFQKPDRHPFGMLPGVTHGYEHESVLAYMLIQCVKAEAWIAVAVTDAYGTLQREGLIQSASESEYRLTEKAKGLLYAHYGKHEQEHVNETFRTGRH